MKKKAIIGEKYDKKLRNSIENLGYKCIVLEKHKKIEWQINSHADIIAFVTQKGEIIVENSINCDFEHIKGDTLLQKGYPRNIAYNGLLMGDNFFHNLKYTDKQILTHLGDVKLHNVKQGFSKCSVLVIDEKTAITSDKGIAKVLKNNKIDVLEIASGYIDLEGYNYGFIGGCGFMNNENQLILTGKISHHIDYDKIIEFLEMRKIEIKYLTDEKIFDVGSILIVN